MSDWNYNWDKNPYYSPEKVGLSLFWELDTGGSYEFDMFVVWQDEDGKLWWATDSGCSCPTPFEGIRGLDDLNDSDVLEGYDEWADREWSKPSDNDRADLVAALSKR